MTTRIRRTLFSTKSTLLLAALLLAGGTASADVSGLNAEALDELRAAGVDKYLGDFTPDSSEEVGDGWVKHTFDSDGVNGPICIAGTPFSVFTRAGNPSRLLIFSPLLSRRALRIPGVPSRPAGNWTSKCAVVTTGFRRCNQAGRSDGSFNPCMRHGDGSAGGLCGHAARLRDPDGHRQIGAGDPVAGHAA